MGYKNKIEWKKPRRRVPVLYRVFYFSTWLPGFFSQFHKIPKSIALNWYYTIGKAIPIYVNNFTISLPGTPLFIIFFHDSNTFKQGILKIGGWLILTIQKSMVYARTLKSVFGITMGNLMPNYADMNHYFDNNNVSLKITNNPIGGYLCPSGMDGKN